jgi:hypothetical protein
MVDCRTDVAADTTKQQRLRLRFRMCDRCGLPVAAAVGSAKKALIYMLK